MQTQLENADRHKERIENQSSDLNGKTSISKLFIVTLQCDVLFFLQQASIDLRCHPKSKQGQYRRWCPQGMHAFSARDDVF